MDTHQHNDYVSGIVELAERADAVALGRAEAQLGYDHQPVEDGQEFELGEVGIKVLHTPGQVVVTCGSGYRSSVAASLLRRKGHDNITNLLGGMSAWQHAGLPLE